MQPPIMEEKLTEVIAFLAQNKWPFRMHASFDHTAKRILGVLEKVHKDVPIDKLRWGLEHCEGLSAHTVDRIAAMGGSLGLQNRMSLDGEAYVEKWGPESAEDAPGFAKIKASGMPFALGTDGNRAASHNPWVGIEWLVTGKTQGGLKHAADRNLLSREEALRAYSAAGAWISGEESKKGTIAPGMLADIAVLSDDYMTVPADRISDLAAVMTVVGGRVVYGADKFASLAPAALKVAPDWLPISSYSSWHKADLAADPVKHAAVELNQAMPQVLAADGSTYTIGCACGLL
jgi:predicted amidohydrolase YtcJ